MNEKKNVNVLVNSTEMVNGILILINDEIFEEIIKEEEHFFERMGRELDKKERE